MSGITNEPGEADWTSANIQKLLAAMKTSIPERDRMSTYTEGLKTVDWNEVAFPPFSPEACQQKWSEILQDMRKIRTLTELIVEAEDAISSSVQKSKAKNVEKYQLAVEEYMRRRLKFRKHELRTNPKRRMDSADTPDQGEQHDEDAEGMPSKPPFNGYNLFIKEQMASMAGVPKTSYISVWGQRWRGLTESQREGYRAHSRELKRQYAIKLNKYLMTLDEEDQEEILYLYGIKRPKLCQRNSRYVKVKRLPGEPRMPSRSGNAIFCKRQMDLLKEKFPNSKERLGKGSQMWKELSNKEKERYQEVVHENFRKYAQELQEWFKTLSSAEQEDYVTSNPAKCRYLDVKKIKFYERDDPCLYRPSDSEDEDIGDSSSDEEEDNMHCEEDEEEEEEEEGGGFMFEMY